MHFVMHLKTLSIVYTLCACRRYAPVPVTFTHAVLANYVPMTATATGV
jgi:hypothetical protein